MFPKIIRVLLISLAFMIVLSAIYAWTASNTVPESGLGSQTQDVTADQMKPAECGALSLEYIATSSSGSTLNDLCSEHLPPIPFPALPAMTAWWAGMETTPWMAARERISASAAAAQTHF